MLVSRRGWWVLLLHNSRLHETWSSIDTLIRRLVSGNSLYLAWLLSKIQERLSLNLPRFESLCGLYSRDRDQLTRVFKREP